MPGALKDLFDSFKAPAQESPEVRDHALKPATAALLVEVMQADPATDAAERKTVIATLRQKFALANDELASLVELAEQTARSASDYHPFTSRINDSLALAQKIQVVENLWQVACADAHLDANENHLISKIAALRHVTQGEYPGAKMWAKKAARLAWRSR